MGKGGGKAGWVREERRSDPHSPDAVTATTTGMKTRPTRPGPAAAGASAETSAARGRAEPGRPHARRHALPRAATPWLGRPRGRGGVPRSPRPHQAHPPPSQLKQRCRLPPHATGCQRSPPSGKRRLTPAHTARCPTRPPPSAAAFGSRAAGEPLRGGPYITEITLFATKCGVRSGGPRGGAGGYRPCRSPPREEKIPNHNPATPSRTPAP